MRITVLNHDGFFVVTSPNSVLFHSGKPVVTSYSKETVQSLVCKSKVTFLISIGITYVNYSKIHFNRKGIVPDFSLW